MINEYKTNTTFVFIFADKVNKMLVKSILKRFLQENCHSFEKKYVFVNIKTTILPFQKF